MATSGELIDATSRVLGIPRATVETYYRSLREAGLVTKGGRGPSAAKMTPRDAAHLLVACGGARFEREAAASVVQDYLRLQSSHAARRLHEEEYYTELDGGWWTLPEDPVPQLISLGKNHNFADAITALMDAVILRELPFTNSYMIEIRFHGPVPAGSISLDFTDENYRRNSEEVAYHLPEGSREYDEAGDLKIERAITWKTIVAISDLLRREE